MHRRVNVFVVRHHSGTGMSQITKETYKLIRTTPSQLNPQNSLSFFTPLHQGQYQLLAKFPQRVKVTPPPFIRLNTH